MIRSMTAFSRKMTQTDCGQFVMEIHTVNRKGLDLNLFLPKEYLFLDIDLRKMVGEHVSRGRVTLRLYPQTSSSSALSEYELSKLKSLKESFHKTAKELGYNPDHSVDFRFLITQLSSRAGDASSNEKEMVAQFKTLTKEALSELITMKEVEGKALEKELLIHLGEIQENLKFVEAHAPEAPGKFEEKLREKLRELTEGGTDLDPRIAQEVAILTEKVDIQEEIARLHSHLSQFEETIQSSNPAVGRTLEFLTQEMHREINTIASKTSETKVSRATIAMRVSLDRIREQVLNIE